MIDPSTIAPNELDPSYPHEEMDLFLYIALLVEWEENQKQMLQTAINEEIMLG